MTTTTMTSTPSFPASMSLKSTYPLGLASSSAPSVSSTSPPSAIPPTLRSLYQRAARAFIQKDISLTYSLMESAFGILYPPTSPVQDVLDSQRRKWDILRITLESTVYCSSTASGADSKSIPAPLRENMVLARSLIVSEMHARSMQLFTPTGMRPRAAFLSAQIITTLALASLKLDCAESSRNMIEDWLAQRGQIEYLQEDIVGYEKVLDLYCLHVLPTLRAWDYAHDFLEYEEELPPISRHRMRTALAEQQKQYMTELQNRAASKNSVTPSEPSSSSQSTPDRTPSPSPSTSSCSSADTTSTRTVVPRTVRANGTALVGGIGSSSSPKPNGTPYPNGTAGHPSSTSNSKGKGKASASQPNNQTNLSRTHTRDQSRDSVLSDRQDVSTTVSYTDLFSLLKTYLRPHLTTNKIVFVALLILFPILSFIFRIRRKRLLNATAAGGAAAAGSLLHPSGSRASTTSSPPSAVNEVRRRLRAQDSGSNVLSSAWREIYRSVYDAVRMAGGGLV